MFKRIALLLCLIIPAVTPQILSASETNIKLATTTSTDNSGLLKTLLPVFEQDTRYKVHVIAVGTGKALRMGQDGDVDVVLVHARSAEDKFIEQGFGDRRYDVMYNDFVIIGPAADPAGIQSASSVGEVMTKIAESQSIFISRGDDSGTNKKELKLWQAVDIEPTGDWYREVGQGMGKVLQIASELEAYTLADRGTWLAYQNKVASKLLFTGDKNLFNPYGIIALSKARYQDLNHNGAQALIDWLISAKGQKLIGEFKITGNQLFIPDAK